MFTETHQGVKKIMQQVCNRSPAKKTPRGQSLSCVFKIKNKYFGHLITVEFIPSDIQTCIFLQLIRKSKSSWAC